MLTIRLKRIGRKNDASYRVVVTEKHRGPKSGKYIENLGFYDPRSDTKKLKAERIKHWIQSGAGVSDTVHNLLISENIIEGKKINVLPQKQPVTKGGNEDGKESEKSEEGGEELNTDSDEETEGKAGDGENNNSQGEKDDTEDSSQNKQEQEEGEATGDEITESNDSENESAEGKQESSGDESSD